MIAGNSHSFGDGFYFGKRRFSASSLKLKSVSKTFSWGRQPPRFFQNRRFLRQTLRFYRFPKVRPSGQTPGDCAERKKHWNFWLKTVHDMPKFYFNNLRKTKKDKANLLIHTGMPWISWQFKQESKNWFSRRIKGTSLYFKRGKTLCISDNEFFELGARRGYGFGL